MSKALYLSALKLSRTALIAWALIILAYAFLVTYLYDSFKEIVELESYLNALPEQFQAVFGLNDPGVEPFTGGVMDPGFFINTEYLGWLPLVLSIFAVFYCGGLVSREAERGTLDLLLSRPLPRYKLVLSKSAVFLSMVLALLLVSWTGILAGMALVDVRLDIGRLLFAHLAIFPLVLAVSGYCTLFSCLYLDPRRSLAFAGVVTAAMYLVNFISPTLGSFSWLENLTVFHYLDVFEVLLNGTIDWGGVALNTAAGMVGFGAAVVVMQRRDLSY